LSYRSEYLRRRNWIQICLMGECRRRDLLRLVETMTELCRPALPQKGASPEVSIFSSKPDNPGAQAV
jgi:hypothetical protein